AAGSPAPGGATPSAGAAGGPAGTVPAGFHQYTDSAGFTIQLPDGMTLTSSGQTSHVFTGNGVRLQIDWTTTPGPSALAAWQAEEPQVAPTLAGYHRVQLQAVTGWRFSNAADWEWTFGSGTTQHSLNRGFVTNDRRYGYALYWTENDSDWNSPANSQARQVAFDSFQPAP
ncbi:hypothetical protein ACQRUO_39080, partial [Kitasatospora sp. LaBMicrA B282]